MSEFAVKGGVLFADGPIYNTWSRRCRAPTSPTRSTTRPCSAAASGLFSYPYYFDAGNQTGFSQPTGVITTTNNGATFLTDLTNPIPERHA